MSQRNLEENASFYQSEVGQVNERSVVNACAKLNLEMIEKYKGGRSAVFLGLGEGGLLDHMASRFQSSIAVEASAKLVTEARDRFAGLKGLEVVQSFFEDYELAPDKRVDCLLGNHVLEHLDDPVAMLKRSLNWLDSDGLAVFTVPNATSLHRRIGAVLGSIEHTNDLSVQDKVVGHRRVYDMPALRNDIVAGGYTVIEEGGFNVKLVSQQQMIGWPAELHDAIYKVSRECPPDLCSNIYIVCRPCRS